jgi:hypothetical protein
MSVHARAGLKIPPIVLVPEMYAEAVPRKPRAAAPLVELILEVPHPLKDAEVVEDVEGDVEAVKLALAD